MGIRITGLNFKCMIIGFDSIGVISGIKECPSLLVPGMEIVGVLCKGPVKIPDGFAISS